MTALVVGFFIYASTKDYLAAIIGGLGWGIWFMLMIAEWYVNGLPNAL